MTVTEALATIRRRVNDEEERVFTDDELVGYLNSGVAVTAMDLIRSKSPKAVKSFPLGTGIQSAALPADFHSLLPGMPLYCDGSSLNRLPGVGSGALEVRYFFIPAAVSDGEDVPLQPGDAETAVNAAVELALMRIGYDVSPERAFRLLAAGNGVQDAQA